MVSNIVVYDTDGNEWVYDMCKCGITPTNNLLITNEVPDVTGRSESGYVEKPVAMFSADTWTHVEYDVCSDE